MERIGAVTKAYTQGKIPAGILTSAISQLPCYRNNALRPGAYGGQYYRPEEDPCNLTRDRYDLPRVTGTYPPIPNRDRKLPRICRSCPAFAPAVSALAAYLNI